MTPLQHAESVLGRRSRRSQQRRQSGAPYRGRSDRWAAGSEPVTRRTPGRCQPGEWAAWARSSSGTDGWSCTRPRIGLSHNDAEDVAQLTWLRLWKHGHQVRQPDRLSAWLVSTARREAIRLAAASSRYVLRADPSVTAPAYALTAIDDIYPVEQEYDWPIEQALNRLPARYQTLLRLLSCDLGLSYSEVAGRMGLPIGSIGPMRMRAIRMLEKTPEFVSGKFSRPATTDLAS